MITNVVRGTCKAIFSGRFYTDTFMQKDGGLPQWPAGRFVVVAGDSLEDISGTDDESTDDTLIQIDIAANTFDERESLAAQVIVAMKGTNPPCSRTRLRREFDEPTRTYRMELDYLFYASSEAAS